MNTFLFAGLTKNKKTLLSVFVPVFFLALFLGTGYMSGMIKTGMLKSSTIDTAELWTCGNDFTDSRDGKIYPTVQIDNDCWMSKNLDYGSRVDGGADQGQDCSSIKKYCFNDTEESCATDGGLYQWDQAMCGEQSCDGFYSQYLTYDIRSCSAPVRGICPEGWHIPSSSELYQSKILFQQYNIMKPLGNYVISPYTTLFSYQSGSTLLWSSTRIFDSKTTKAYNLTTATALTQSSTDRTFGELKNFRRESGISVRCMKDKFVNEKPYIVSLTRGINYKEGDSLYTTIKWTIKGGAPTELEMDHDVGSVLRMSGVRIKVSTTPTTYTLRAANAIGTSLATITVSATDIPCGDVFMDTRDGKNYITLQIGNQCWMGNNLNYGTSSSADANGGSLYQWNQIMSGSTTEGTQGICPSGWHIPSDAEWTTLEESTCVSTGENESRCHDLFGAIDWRGKTEGTKLKSGGGLGFRINPSAGVNLDGKFFPNYTYYWTSTPQGTNTYWYRGFGMKEQRIYKSSTVPTSALSVLCIRDNTSTVDVYTGFSPTKPQREAPIFTPAAGAYINGQTVTITSPKSNEKIFFYRMNDGRPNSYDILYTGPIVLPPNSVTTISAIGIQDGFLDSDVVKATYITGNSPDSRNCEDFVYGNNRYKSVIIGNQCWMAENLNYGTRFSSDANGGSLYQWNQIMADSTTEGAQGICPNGWHIPSDADWTTLEEFTCSSLGKSVSECHDVFGKTDWRGSNEGTKLKLGGGMGFDINPNVGINIGSKFYPNYSYYWTSTLNSNSRPVYRAFKSDKSTIYRDSGYQSSAFSVRCIKRFIPEKAPVITEFVSDKSVVELFNSKKDGATLSWKIDGYVSALTLESGHNDLSSVLGKSNQTGVEPFFGKTTYTLTATNALGSDSKKITLDAINRMPNFITPSGKIRNGQTITLADDWGGSIIYYTLDGTAPTTSSMMYTGPILLPDNATTTIKAFATKKGYLDSNVVSMTYTTTTIDWECGEKIIDSRDPNNIKKYNTISINNDCWMAENINVGTRVDAGVTQGTSADTIQKYCYANMEENCTTYGGLYQWNQAMAGSTLERAQGICPRGWHIPTYAEFQYAPATGVYPGGLVNPLPTPFSLRDEYSYIWSSSQMYDGTGTKLASVNQNIQSSIVERVQLYEKYASKGFGPQWGFSVRCKRDTLPVATPSQPTRIINFQGNILNDSSLKGASVAKVKLWWTLEGDEPTTLTISADYDKEEGFVPISVLNSNTVIVSPLREFTKYTLKASSASGTDTKEVSFHVVSAVLPNKPRFSPSAGIVDNGEKIIIEVPQISGGERIYYTTDGSTPTKSSNLYTGPITLPKNTTTTIRAISRLAVDSDVVTAKYTTTSFNCGVDSLIDNRDGLSFTYKTVKIGDQCWMADNLNRPAALHTVIANVFIYKFDWLKLDPTTGKLQGICPTNWHIPSDAEWTILEKTVCMNSGKSEDTCYNNFNQIGWRGTNEGTSLKPGESTGFNANLNGRVWIGSNYYSNYAYYWTSTPAGNNQYWYRAIGVNQSGIYRNSDVATSEFSVRCVNDDVYSSSLPTTSTLPGTSTITTPPTITTLTASPSTINSGSSTTLAWTLSGSSPTALSIDNGVGSVLGTTSIVVNPLTTTTYTLTATNSVGTETKQVTVTVVPKSLVAHYTMEGNADDTSGNANNGTATAVTYGAGKIQGGIFNGSSSYVQLPPSSTLNIAGDMSVSAWVYRSKDSGGSLVHKDNQYAIHMSSTGAISWADSSKWDFGTFGYHGNLPAESWQHIAVTKTGSTVTLYVNGTAIVTKSFGGPITTNSYPAFIGCYAGTGTSCTGSFFAGMIDEVKIWNYGLTTTEVQSEYNRSLALATTTLDPIIPTTSLITPSTTIITPTTTPDPITPAITIPVTITTPIPIIPTTSLITPSIPSWSCGSSLVDTRTNTSYPTVQIDSQCWMASNLDIGTRIAAGNNQGVNCNNILKYCYADTDASCSTYGGLYTWNMAMCNETTEKAQGICPTGWHIPSNTELSAAGSTLQGQLVGGYVSVIPSLYYQGLNTYGYLSTSTQKNSEYAAIGLFQSGASFQMKEYGKQWGFSIRCVKDN